MLAAVELAGALAGCAANDSGQLLIDPGRYDVYKCDDLAKRWKVVSTREKDLRELMARADQSSGGVVVSALAYQADYEAVLSDERLLQRTAAEKNCALPLQAGAAPPSAQPQAGQPLAGQPLTTQSTGGRQQNSVYQSDQSIR
ncbi:MAG TPA: twin-arginine translocation pathway signal [Xanthobacteraceae bacterium]|nr:twin-arginine translocation pathway signal [Xanthobacteraceae bacterium]